MSNEHFQLGGKKRRRKRLKHVSPSILDGLLPYYDAKYGSKKRGGSWSEAKFNKRMKMCKKYSKMNYKTYVQQVKKGEQPVSPTELKNLQNMCKLVLKQFRSYKDFLKLNPHGGSNNFNMNFSEHVKNKNLGTDINANTMEDLMSFSLDGGKRRRAPRSRPMSPTMPEDVFGAQEHGVLSVKPKKRAAKRTAKRRVAKRSAKRRVAKRSAKRRVAKRRTVKRRVAKRGGAQTGGKRRVAKRRTVKRVAKRRVVKRRVAKRVAKRRPASKRSTQSGGKRKLPASFKKPFKPDALLADIVGSKPRPRQDFLKDLWTYFKKHKLNEGREIHADEKVKKLAGKSKFTMFEVMKIMNKHIKE